LGEGGRGTICIWERGGGGQFTFGRESEGGDLFSNASEGDGENLYLEESGRTICICERAEDDLYLGERGRKDLV